MIKWILEIQEKKYEKILEELRERLRNFIIEVGKNTNNTELVDFAKKLNRNGIELCLHLGFSEKVFFESLSGVVKLEPFTIKKDDRKI